VHGAVESLCFGLSQSALFVSVHVRYVLSADVVVS
jgi:hypothetical protein